MITTDHTYCQQYNWILIPIIWSFLLQFKFSLFNFQFYSFDFEFTTQFWSFADKFRNLLSSTDESLKPVSRKPWGHSQLTFCFGWQAMLGIVPGYK